MIVLRNDFFFCTTDKLIILELKNAMRCDLECCYRLCKVDPETIMLMKEFSKNKCLSMSLIFRRDCNFKKNVCLPNYFLKLAEQKVLQVIEDFTLCK